MTLDRNGLEILTREECMRLLATTHIGRMALSVGALPVVLPVNFTLMDGDIIIRTAGGSKMGAAMANAVVAFEIDGSDSLYHQGWSVLVRGVARPITEADELERANRLPLRPWASREASHYVRISTEVVSGRRVGTFQVTMVPPPGPRTA